MTARAPDVLRQEGLGALRTRRFAEAEKLYREAVKSRPGFAEAHVELGIALMLQGRLDDAAASCRQGVSLRPDYANGHYHLGEVLAAQSNLEEAAAAWRQTLVLAPDLAEAHAGLGNLHLRAGRLDDAEAAFRRVMAIDPNLSEAHNNLGIVLGMTGRWDEAIAAFRQAVALRPGDAEAHNNLGIALASTGRFDGAVSSYRHALALAPDHVGAHNNLGNALKEQGRLGDAEASYRRALALRPDQAVTWHHLGMVLCEAGRIGEGFDCFMRHAELNFTAAPPGEPAHKLQHDREQAAYLAQAGTAGGGFILADGGRLAGPAVNPANTGGIERQWRYKQPQIVVIDNLLTGGALEKLRRYCWGSTIWRKTYDEGYLGAMPEHGFACPLLAQIGEELRAVFPAIFAGHPLLQLWAFKYDSRMGGIGLHADFAAVNVNFWITPDDANLDPQSGGLVVWDKAAPLDWSFTRYNRSPEDIRDFLAREGANKTTIPYRANRAVIFDSDLFHETDRIVFKDGYRNRRINVTLLYGRRASR